MVRERMKKINEKMRVDEWNIHLELSCLYGLGMEYISETKVISEKAQLESSAEYVTLRLNPKDQLSRVMFLQNFTRCYWAHWIPCRLKETSVEWNESPNGSNWLETTWTSDTLHSLVAILAIISKNLCYVFSQLFLECFHYFLVCLSLCEYVCVRESVCGVILF